MELVLILFAAVLILLFIYYYMKAMVLGIYMGIIQPIILYFRKNLQPYPQEYKDILWKYFGYYKVLPHEEKKIFEDRLRTFMYSKNFVGRGGLKVTTEMKVLISASAIQLTFGLPMVYLSNFDQILIYPDSYYSNINKQYHYGEVNPRAGVIVLSWLRFMEGYTDAKDSLNVGLHEMAHAIHFENQIANQEFGFLDGYALKDLREIFRREQEAMGNGDQNYLRSYAATDEYEFFAVSIEHFFEDPRGLKENIPDLYETLMHLLNQDPMRLVS